MRRVVIIGSPGSGKSTLARRLATKLDVPVVHFDKLRWLPGWTLRDRDEFGRLVIGAAAGEAWVMDGNYRSTMPARLARADTLVMIDLPAWLCIASVLRRVAKGYGRVRPDMPEGCPERFDAEFIRYIWDYRRTGRTRALEQLRDVPPHVRCVRLRSRRAVDSWLAGVSKKRFEEKKAEGTKG